MRSNFFAVLLIFSFSSFAAEPELDPSIENLHEEEGQVAPQAAPKAEVKLSPIEKMRKDSFTPHITVNARTGEKWDVNLQRALGANINSNVLLSSITLSVLERLEIGTAPIYYGLESHKYNFGVKYNFWRAEEFAWSIAVAVYEFDIDETTLPAPFNTQDIGLQLSASQITLNYFPKWTRFKFGLMANLITTSLTGTDTLTQLLSTERQNEMGFDVSYPVNDKMDLTIGVGGMREEGLFTGENMLFGFGPSVRWYRPGQFFTTPTFGLHYSPDNGSFQYLLSSQINFSGKL